MLDGPVILRVYFDLCVVAESLLDFGLIIAFILAVGIRAIFDDFSALHRA